MPNEEEKPLKGATQKGGGGFLAGIFCGTDCCRKDAKPETDIVMPTNTPIVYKKAVDDLHVKMPQTASVQDTTTEDAFIQAEDVDVEERNSGEKGAETASASESDYPDDYDESSEEEESEEEDPEPEPKEYQRDHAKSIAALKASFEPVKQNLQGNPAPEWKSPIERGADLEDSSDEEDDAPPPRPTQKKKDIEALKQSYQQQLGGKESKAQDSERVELKTNASMRTQVGRKPMPERSAAARDEEAEQRRRRKCCSIQ